MEDGNGSDDVSATKAKKKAVSKRSFILADGKEADNIEAATGACYTLLVPSGDIPFAYQYGANPEFDRLCALFGYHTKIGNVANTVLNDKDEPGTPEDAAEELKAWLAKAQASPPVWAERSSGGPGVRVDRDVLADSIVAVAQAGGKTVDRAKVLARLNDEPAYLKAARQVTDVANEYATRMGKTAKSIDDLL